jgi:hypothetical protein
LFDSVSGSANVASVPVVGKVTFVLKKLLLTCFMNKHHPLFNGTSCANVVASVSGAVIVTLLTVAAVATPKKNWCGTSGEVAKNSCPVQPSESVIACEKIEVNEPKLVTLFALVIVFILN